MLTNGIPPEFRGGVHHTRYQINTYCYLYIWLDVLNGQIEFLELNSDSGVHGCEPEDFTLLEAPAKLLGVSSDDLGQHLTHR